MAFCPNCGTQIPAGVASCPNCAGTSQATPAAVPTVAAVGLTDNVAGALAYVTIIPAILFLVLEPYNRRRFIRFHAFQCIFFCIAWIAIWFCVGLIGHFPFLGWAIAFLISPLIGIAGFILWLVLMLKAYQGQMFKLPVIGDIAEQQANTVP